MTTDRTARVERWWALALAFAATTLMRPVGGGREWTAPVERLAGITAAFALIATLLAVRARIAQAASAERTSFSWRHLLGWTLGTFLLLTAALNVTSRPRPLPDRVARRNCASLRRRLEEAMRLYMLDGRRVPQDAAHPWKALFDVGYIDRLPIDPGQGPDSIGHFAIDPSGHVTCTNHTGEGPM